MLTEIASSSACLDRRLAISYKSCNVGANESVQTIVKLRKNLLIEATVIGHSSTMPLELVWPLAALVATASAATIGASINNNGVTELFGDSFGEPGVATEYDYVVSDRSRSLVPLQCFTHLRNTDHWWRNSREHRCRETCIR